MLIPHCMSRGFAARNFFRLHVKAVCGSRPFSDWTARGHDLLHDSLTHGSKPKIVLEGHAPTGFDVLNVIKKVDQNDSVESGTLHMNGSIMAFPFGCFFWNVSRAEDITLESLSPALLHQPRLEYLFIGADQGEIPPAEMERIRRRFRAQNTFVEKVSLTNAMGTFNILNGEDRQVAAALILDPRED